MSSRGELYINEECRDTFMEDLNKWYGDDWELDVGGFIDLWDISEMPEQIEIDVLNSRGEVIGKVEVTNNFYVEDCGCGKYVEVEPEDIRRIK